MSKVSLLPPVIKWSGSKRPIAAKIGALIPSGGRYFEPFVGGGAVLPFRGRKIGFASDVIPELVALWKAIQQEPDRTADEYRTRWERLQKEGYTVYYAVRDSFNATRNEFDFLFLTRTCVNGLIRYNDKREFNNSFHLTRPGINPERLKSIIFAWSRAIQGIEFHCLDYREALKGVRPGDFVFLDPPYGGTKGRYWQEDFDFKAFFNELDRLTRIGAKWILTFDGTAGGRSYAYAPPRDIYTERLDMVTGLSPFTRIMKTAADVVHESVYLNFERSPEFIPQRVPERVEEPSLFGAVYV
jgi:DNA adenine methylase